MRFLDALVAAKNDNKNIVIPDIKCYSPKEGDLMQGRSPVEYAKLLCKAGAKVLSVVTEEKEFHGSIAMLKEISAAVEVPILRKDFIHTKEDLLETVEAGASAILLMCSCLTEEELRYLYQEALNVGLDPFVETHKREDFAIVKELGAKLVGINNRDILVLERDDGDVSNTISLADEAPEDAFLVTESSIKDADQVRAAIAAGADAALVGTAILSAKYTESFYQMLCRKTSLKVCGFMNETDIDLCVKQGVDRIGMVVDYPLYVPWNLDVETAANLRKCIPSGHKCCIVVGGGYEKVLSIVTKVKPDMIQLHYKENLEETKKIAEALEKLGVDVIKTVPTKEEACLEQFGTSDLKEILDGIAATKVKEVLVDPRHGEDVVNKNLSLDMDYAKQVLSLSKLPVILAGGITVDNIAEKIHDSGCCYVDVMNGSEDEPGKKNEDKIARMVAAIDCI